jgi:hypothetical protein
MKTLRPFLLISLLFSFSIWAMQQSSPLVEQAKNELQTKFDLLVKKLQTRKSFYPDLLGQHGTTPILSKAAILVAKEDIEAYLDDISDEEVRRMLAANFRSKMGFVTLKRREISDHLNDKYKLDNHYMTASELEDFNTVRSINSGRENNPCCCPPS